MRISEGYLTSDDDERPLSLRVHLREDDALCAILTEMKPNAALAAGAILANFRIEPRATFFYSRDRNHYSHPAVRQRYYPPYYAYFSMMSAVDALVDAALVINDRTAPSPWAKKRSRLRATAKLSELIEGSPASSAHTVPNELIVLRTAGKAKRLMAYDDTSLTHALRAEVEAHNAFQESFSVSLVGVPVHPMLSVAARQYHLVFTGDFNHGGRWYAPWQNISKSLRPLITINGGQTEEFDFSCCHPRLLGAHAGIDWPQVDDIYSAIPNFDRAEVKAALPILLNASSSRKAEGALAWALQKQGHPEPRARARALCRAVKKTWQELAPYWCTGIGLRLQRVDAEICTEVQREMRGLGIPVLSIHDGFIVPAMFLGVLREVANAGMDEACRRLRGV